MVIVPFDQRHVLRTTDTYNTVGPEYTAGTVNILNQYVVKGTLWMKPKWSVMREGWDRQFETGTATARGRMYKDA